MKTIKIARGNKRPSPAPKTAPIARKANRVGRPTAGSVKMDAQDVIANAALPLFATMSFAAVSTKDIAGAAGLNTALIYYYFGSKEELFRRTILLAAQRACHRFRLLAARQLPADAFVNGWIDCHETEFETVVQLLRISMDYASAPERHRNVDEAISGFHTQTREMLRDALTKGVEDRTFADLDVQQTVTFMATFLDGIYMRRIIFPQMDPQPEIGELRAFLAARLNATEG